MKGTGRKSWWVALIASFALVAAACNGAADETRSEEREGRVVAVLSGGSYQRHFLAAQAVPFENETGIAVDVVESTEDATVALQQQIAAENVQWDLVSCDPTFVAQTPDLYQPIDYSIVESTDDIVVPGVAGEKIVGHDLEAYPIIAYRTDTFEGNEPTGWADFYDVEGFPGPRALPDFGGFSAWVAPATALLAMGVTPEELFPLDLDRAYTFLDDFRPNIRAFLTSFTQGQDLLRSGEVQMVAMTDGRALQLKDLGTPVDVVWNQAFQEIAGFCVPVGAPNAENAFEFMEFYLTNTEGQAVFSAGTFYGPVTTAAEEDVRRLGLEDFSSLHADELIPQSDAMLNYLADNSQEILDRWNEYVQGA